MAGVVGTMKFAKQQAEMLFDQCDTNEGERTPEMVSQWEFFKFLDYDPPSQPTWGDGYGDIDPWGRTHKKFNKLRHTDTPPKPAAPAAQLPSVLFAGAAGPSKTIAKKPNYAP